MSVTNASKSILRRLLEERNLTVDQFAKQTGLSRRTLEKYSSGASSFQRTQAWFLLNVADALHIDPHVLLGEEARTNEDAGQRIAEIQHSKPFIRSLDERQRPTA